MHLTLTDFFSSLLSRFLTRPAVFPIEHRRTESVCYYAIKSLFDVLYLDMWRIHYTCEVTTLKSDALTISTETNQAQFCIISGTATFICWCRVRIEIIYPNLWCYRLITSLFVVRMRIIISLGPRDIIPGIRPPNIDVIER
jgi:hypothetical protein